MTREQAIDVLKNRYYSGVTRSRPDDEWRLAMDTVIDVLRGPQPDPDTGLVPCGCGTPMLLMGDDETQYWVECGDSVHCPHFIGQAYDGAGIYQTPEEAIKAARVAMGWKGGAE